MLSRISVERPQRKHRFAFREEAKAGVAPTLPLGCDSGVRSDAHPCTCATRRGRKRQRTSQLAAGALRAHRPARDLAVGCTSGRAQSSWAPARWRAPIREPEQADFLDGGTHSQTIDVRVKGVRIESGRSSAICTWRRPCGPRPPRRIQCYPHPSGQGVSQKRSPRPCASTAMVCHPWAIRSGRTASQCPGVIGHPCSNTIGGPDSPSSSIHGVAFAAATNTMETFFQCVGSQGDACARRMPMSPSTTRPIDPPLSDLDSDKAFALRRPVASRVALRARLSLRRYHCARADSPRSRFVAVRQPRLSVPVTPCDIQDCPSCRLSRGLPDVRPRLVNQARADHRKLRPPSASLCGTAGVPAPCSDPRQRVRKAAR